MLNFLRIKFHCMGLILKNKEKSAASDKYDMLLAYVKFVLTYIFAVRLLRMKPLKAKGIGLRFNFYSYKVFVGLFEEIFIYKTYYFTCNGVKPIIIDCGSNIGISVLYFKKRYPDAEIIAFEADTDAFKMLEKNVKDNNFKGITLINKALYDEKDRKLNFYANDSDSGNPVNSLTQRKDEFNFKQPVSVLTDTLSGYMAGKIDFLKMDIEGAEHQVLNEISGKDKLKFIDKCVLEYHHHIDPDEDRLGVILSMFENAGFGYQLSTWTKPPFLEQKFQDINIYFYSKAHNKN